MLTGSYIHSLRHLRTQVSSFLSIALMCQVFTFGAIGVATALTPSAAQAQYNPAAAATRCRQFTTSERNMRALADNNAALNAFVICIDLGVDPPLKARQEYGRGPAAGVSMAQVSGRTCPPFATCLYGARVFDEVKPGPPAGISRRQLMGAP